MTRTQQHRKLDKAFQRSHPFQDSTYEGWRRAGHHHIVVNGVCSYEQKELEALPTVDSGEVRDLMSSGHHYLDVRLGKDFDKAHADGARNISYYLSVTPSGKEKNPRFVDEVAALFGKDEHLIVGCNTGVRSRLATKDLLDAGFKNVRNLQGGYQSFLRSESQQPEAHQQ
uniref:Rhodanese domain-containing protein n=1 Tax=Oryza punctata TaxID=4537 RepID=A0A0E0JVS1_ORYPU